MPDTVFYAGLLKRWMPVAKEWLYFPEEYPGLSCFGTGESYHWAVQTNTTAFAAIATLARCTNDPELREQALQMLRYTLKTHKSGDCLCSNGKQWGLSWISGLSLERMRHGIDALEEYLTDGDKALLRRVMECECNHLLDEYPVQAGYGFYENRPESNIWNGALLLRTAICYPDAPRAKEYCTRATDFFVNGISIPADATSDVEYDGRKVRDMHVGANFTENISLNHNGYQNMGYAALALSNVAFIHFSAKLHGWELPAVVYHHVRELWETLKHFFFEDGRLIRIGGDDRVRYSYCQDYALPAWLLAWDLFQDPMALQFEAKWRDIVAHEAMRNADGAFLSERLCEMRKTSPFYYTRLEGDRAVSMSYPLFWRHAGVIASPNALAPLPPDSFSWQDERHGATLEKSEKRIASMTWDACARPVVLAIPPNRSDLAEWQNNLSGELITSNLAEASIVESHHRQFKGGFLNWGSVDWIEKSPFGEGEQEEVFAHHQVAAAALPDGQTTVVLQYAVTTRRIYLRRIQGLGYKLPNDLFNGYSRKIVSAEGETVLHGIPEQTEVCRLNSQWLNVDGELGIIDGYGMGGLTLLRQNHRQIRVAGFPHTSLYCEEICSQFDVLDALVPAGKCVLDAAGVIVTGADAAMTAQIAASLHAEKSGTATRCISLTGTDGIAYRLEMDFSKGVAEVN